MKALHQMIRALVEIAKLTLLCSLEKHIKHKQHHLPPPKTFLVDDDVEQARFQASTSEHFFATYD